MIDLRLEDLSYEYPGGVLALDAVDLHIPAGSTVALIGANGSGKSTLAQHLDGLLRPTLGRVLVDGQDAADSSVAQLARSVGVCFQHPDRQIFGRDVRAEVEFGPRHLGASHEQAFVRGKEALERVGLAGDISRHPGDLGETRRKLLSIASVLAMETPVVVFDEPTTGLDAHGIELVEGIVAELRREGRTVVVISHDMRFVAESCQRLVLLDHGAVGLDGTPSAVFARDNWPTLHAAGIEPPYAAIVADRLGLGSIPTEAELVQAIATRP